MDKHTIYLFICYSIEDFELNKEVGIKPIPKFSADSANAISFYEVFCEQHHLQSVIYTTVLCIY